MANDDFSNETGESASTPPPEEEDFDEAHGDVGSALPVPGATQSLLQPPQPPGGVSAYGDVVLDWLFYSVAIPLSPIAIGFLILYVFSLPLTPDDLLRDGVLLAYAATLAPQTMKGCDRCAAKLGASSTILRKVCLGVGSIVILVAAAGFAIVTVPRLLGEVPEFLRIARDLAFSNPTMSLKWV